MSDLAAGLVLLGSALGMLAVAWLLASVLSLPAAPRRRRGDVMVLYALGRGGDE